MALYFNCEEFFGRQPDVILYIHFWGQLSLLVIHCVQANGNKGDQGPRKRHIILLDMCVFSRDRKHIHVTA